MGPAPGPVGRGTNRVVRLQVLVIDDEKLFERPFLRMLRPHEARFFSSPSEALAHLRQESSYDVVLCDVSMPEMLGTELHEQLTRERPEIAARFVFLTGGLFTEDTRDYLERVDNLCLLKPFERAAMLEVVERAAAKGARL